MELTNRLGDALSPYLQQHADNPVAWQPWDAQALDAARELDRPILLSIGYSACHWCHVMEHESFEDKATAELMNEHFINIKVDREERPDLDKIYQVAHQLFQGRAGGWPLTAFLDPSTGLPFFVGTYFPPRPRHGMPAFSEVLEQLNGAWRNNRDQIEAQGKRLKSFYEESTQAGPAGGEITQAHVKAAVQSLQNLFDEQHGGFGKAPKFPQPSWLALLSQVESAEARRMLSRSLDAMAAGGLHDHLAGGFFRYCVDAAWEIPHFEKMLYDNAQLLTLYARAGDHDVTEEIVAWLTTMQSRKGGFFSSLDADSGGREGGYYTWTREEARRAVGEHDWSEFSVCYGLAEPANFEGTWHLIRMCDPQQARSLRDVRERLREWRDLRTTPARDDKILTAWNALTVSGLAIAGRTMGRVRWVDMAEAALKFLRQHHWRDGVMAVGSRDGTWLGRGYLDDYAFTLQACLDLLPTRWSRDTLDFAEELAESLLEHFAAPDGGFYFTDGSEKGLSRLMPLQDEAIPSGNAVAAEALWSLGELLGETRYLDAAEATLRRAAAEIKRTPLAYGGLLRAWLNTSRGQVVVRSDAEVSLPISIRGYRIPLSERSMNRRFPPKGRFVAYKCSGSTCYAPIDSPSELRNTTQAG